jgi:hypothetical protein
MMARDVLQKSGMTGLMRRLTFVVALCASLTAVGANAQPGGAAEPERGTRALGNVGPDDKAPTAPDTDVGDRPRQTTIPNPDDATRHEPDTHGGSMPPVDHAGPTHPPGPGGAKSKDAP